VPGDKSISHRALLMAARAEGVSRLSGLSDGLDVGCTAKAVACFGATLTPQADALVVEGGSGLLHEPATVIDVGNSGTGIRLLAGWAAALDGIAVLAGDASVSQRPMDRIAAPLRLMGAFVDGRDHGRLPPLVVRGGGLHGIDYRLPVASAQVKGAILLAALGAEGSTTVREGTPTRSHTEEMLRLFGADVSTGDGWAQVHPGPLRPVDMRVPGDPSQAAFWVVAACITPGSELTVEDVYVGPSRAGFVDVLRRMGADIELIDLDPPSATASIRARHSPLVATDVAGPEVPGLIDEIPVLAVAAATAAGTTTFSGAAELRVKESDRVESTVSALRSLGIQSAGLPDGLVVEGGRGAPFRGGRVDSGGDHRIAMAAAVAALAAADPVTISGWESVATSYPRFEEDLAGCVS
jgi:3-phosphoshikimate 1-carboxyvinyltransferase